MNKTLSNNPYVNTLVEMGYDEKDCRGTVASVVAYPRTIYGRTFDTKEQYDEDLHEFLNGL